MPGSRIQGKSNISEWIFRNADIKTIVDVGPGSGTYPKLLGDSFTYIGIEIWEPYVEMFDLKQFYKEIIIGDIRDVDLPDGDCIIFGDILEHLLKRDALEVIRRAEEHYKHMVISIPISGEEGVVVPGAIHYNNPNEAHISAWLFEEIYDMYDWDPETMLVQKNRMGIFMK